MSDHQKEKPQRFILLPAVGLKTVNETIDTQQFFYGLKVNSQQTVRMNSVVSLDKDPHLGIKVIDSIHENGPKLVELSSTTLAAFRAYQPSVRIIPEVFYYPQRVQFKLDKAVKLSRTTATLTIKVLTSDHQPIANALVVAFTDFDQRTGADGTTNQLGEVSLRFRNASVAIEQLHIYPRSGYWSCLKKDLVLKHNDSFVLDKIEFGFKDVLRHLYPNSNLQSGQGVKVGVIDSGVGPHKDLSVAGGRNCVTGEDPANYYDSDQHGTHVAGIIAARGNNPSSVQGVAPGVDLFAYRVFGKGEEGASNYDIAKAIDQAIDDGCDLINMSLGGGRPDELVKEAIQSAYQQGTIVFVATGNDNRAPVSFPASFSLSIGVAAMGRKGTFPTTTTDANNIRAPFGSDRKNFVAAFSNIGSEVDLIGPGVSVISTVPTDEYVAMSGTSMACPAATGAAARLLSSQHQLLTMPRGQARAEAMIHYLSNQVSSLGFESHFEGLGIYR